MKEIFEYLKSSCDEMKSVLRVSQQELYFRFDNFGISIIFTDFLDENFDESFINISDVDFSVFDSKIIKKIILQEESLLHYDETTKREFLDNYVPHSQSMFNVINSIRTQYPDAIYSYLVQPFCIDDSFSMCDDIWVYGFQIEIDENYWADKRFFDFIINTLDKVQPHLSIPNFYDTEKELKDSFDVKVLNSNTKIRRLGYLKILLKMIKEQAKVPVSKINTKFEKYCQEYNSYLQSYKNKKGNVIITKTGNSANPYIELAVSLGLIHKSAGVFEIGKIGKVYNILKKRIDNIDTSPFVLSKFDTTFFLELLLKEDYWFLYAILEQTAINPTIAYKHLKKEFKNILLKQIAQFIDEAQENNGQKVLPLKMIERRINDWKKPEVYMEHVLMPRLNWLYDMELIDLKNDLSFCLTSAGKKLIYNLATWNDIALHRLVSPVSYIDSYFMKMINFVFDFQKVRCTQEMDKVFEQCIEDSFLLFRTLAPNRVTFSLCSNYTKQIMFWNNKGIVDTENIKKVFEKEQILGYIYKYQEHYKDGYIQKHK
ncbi:hypothetical protein EZS27_014957 [termite gut metagenome]|uniref:Uncharacterized protein n=1 Tax=termite gut metagenome TaxID=433724 RepID=A0A5J4RUC5_9ZZZZ